MRAARQLAMRCLSLHRGCTRQLAFLQCRTGFVHQAEDHFDASLACWQRSSVMSHSVAVPRQFHSSAVLRAIEQVLVPSMGDSITEGTIVNVSKSLGDSIAEDEVVAQIETDKVTIDVRAPYAGSLKEILVKEDDTVEVGQTIAKLDTEGSGGGAAEEFAPSASKEGSEKAQETPQVPTHKAEQEAAPETGVRSPQMDTAHAQVQQAAQQQSREPGKAHITFPPRRTADGTRISSLPAAEALAAAEQLTGHAFEPSPSGVEPLSQQEAASEMEGVRLRRWAVGAPFLMDEDWQPAPGKWALSQREMDMIDLGGAEP